MRKHMHDISMDRGFSDEYIGMKSGQLCAMKDKVYTTRRHRDTLIFL